MVRVWSHFLTHLRAEVACLRSADGDVVAQRRGSEEEFMENASKAGKFSPWILIDQTLTHHCDSNKGTPLVGLRVYKKGNIFRPMMERQFDDIIIMSMFCILIHIIVPFQIFLSF